MSTDAYITEWLAGDNVVCGGISLDEAGFCETQRPSDQFRRARTHFLHRELSTRRQRLIGTEANTHTHTRLLYILARCFVLLLCTTAV